MDLLEPPAFLGAWGASAFAGVVNVVVAGPVAGVEDGRTRLLVLPQVGQSPFGDLGDSKFL